MTKNKSTAYNNSVRGGALPLLSAGSGSDGLLKESWNCSGLKNLKGHLVLIPLSWAETHSTGPACSKPIQQPGFEVRGLGLCQPNPGWCTGITLFFLLHVPANVHRFVSYICGSECANALGCFRLLPFMISIIKAFLKFVNFFYRLIYSPSMLRPMTSTSGFVFFLYRIIFSQCTCTCSLYFS